MTTEERLKEIIRRFSDQTVYVLGDVMLDLYLYGSVERISPEAPVPVLKEIRREILPGGSSNVSNNIVSLGAKAITIGVVGNDLEHEQLKSALNKLGIDHYFIEEEGRKTTRKTRAVAGARDQQVIRIDYEDNHHINQNTRSKILDYLRTVLKKDCVLNLSDYDKGLFKEGFCRTSIDFANSLGVKTIVDPKTSDSSHYRGAYLIKPNLKEAKAMYHRLYETDNVTLERMGNSLVEKTGSNFLITMGEAGMALFEKGKGMVLIPTKGLRVFDVTGAGDTIAGLVGLGLASGATLHESAILANLAGGVVVQKPGTSTVTIAELQDALNKHYSK